MSEWELIEDPQEITAAYLPNEGGIMWEGKAYLPADYVLHADREPSDAEVESAARALAEWDGADWHRPDPEFAAYWSIPKSAYRRGARLALIAAQEVRDVS